MRLLRRRGGNEGEGKPLNSVTDWTAVVCPGSRWRLRLVSALPRLGRFREVFGISSISFSNRRFQSFSVTAG